MVLGQLTNSHSLVICVCVCVTPVERYALSQMQYYSSGFDKGEGKKMFSVSLCPGMN